MEKDMNMLGCNRLVFQIVFGEMLVIIRNIIYYTTHLVLYRHNGTDTGWLYSICMIISLRLT